MHKFPNVSCPTVIKEKQEYYADLFHLLYSTITKKANITTVRLSPVITFSFHHAGDHFFLLELVLVTLLLGAQEPDDGEDNVIVGEGWRVVEADSTKRSCGACNHILEQNKLQDLLQRESINVFQQFRLVAPDVKNGAKLYLIFLLFGKGFPMGRNSLKISF